MQAEHNIIINSASKMRVGAFFILFSLVFSFLLGCCSARELGDDGDLSKIISSEMFEELLAHRNNCHCLARGFYDYNSFIEAAKEFPAFGNTGNYTMLKKEIAAFFAQTSEKTTGRGRTDTYDRGYCYKKEVDPKGDYCDYNYPCPLAGQYYGRGPIQLTGNYNYIMCGDYLGVDLLHNPDLLITDPVLSFKSAIWFWMTPQNPKPSCHNVIVDHWQPTPTDEALGRLPGFGLTTNIINGNECGKGVPNQIEEDSIGYFKNFCQKFEIEPGENLDCYHQLPYGYNLMVQSE